MIMTRYTLHTTATETPHLRYEITKNMNKDTIQHDTIQDIALTA